VIGPTTKNQPNSRGATSVRIPPTQTKDPYILMMGLLISKEMTGVMCPTGKDSNCNCGHHSKIEVMLTEFDAIISGAICSSLLKSFLFFFFF